MANQTTPLSAVERLEKLGEKMEELVEDKKMLEANVVLLQNIIAEFLDHQELLVEGIRSDTASMRVQYTKRYKERLEKIKDDLRNVR